MPTHTKKLMRVQSASTVSVCGKINKLLILTCDAILCGLLARSHASKKGPQIVAEKIKNVKSSDDGSRRYSTS